MDRVTYAQLIKRWLADFAERGNRNPARGIELLCVFDDDAGVYALMKTGWAGNRRVKGTTVLVRIRDGKIWVEEDWTDEGIANALVEAGVPRDQIVLGFQPPSMRPLTEFASA